MVSSCFLPWIAADVPARSRDAPNRRPPAISGRYVFADSTVAVRLDWAGDLSLRGCARKLLPDDEDQVSP
jgi:hypothetical protein